MTDICSTAVLLDKAQTTLRMLICRLRVDLSLFASSALDLALPACHGMICARFAPSIAPCCHFHKRFCCAAVTASIESPSLLPLDSARPLAVVLALPESGSAVAVR